MIDDFQHSLVIGGTGMLAGATRRIASHSDVITLVSRDPSPMTELVGETPSNLVDLDYVEVDALEGALRAARERSGEFDLALLWIHSVGDAALEVLARLFGEQDSPPRTVHVIGSRGRSAPLPGLTELPGLVYQRVLLGHVDDGERRRWLTHKEIRDGTWRAVVSEKRETVVGELD